MLALNYYTVGLNLLLFRLVIPADLSIYRNRMIPNETLISDEFQRFPKRVNAEVTHNHCVAGD